MFNRSYNKKLPLLARKMLLAGVVLTISLFSESRTDLLSGAAANSNEPPLLLFPLDTTFYEDTQLALPHAFILEAVQDPDHHDSLLTIQIRADSGLVFYRFDQESQQHLFWANRDVDSCGYFHIRVQDPLESTLTESFIVDIIPVNDAPLLAAFSDTCSKQDTIFKLPLTGCWDDVDNDFTEMQWLANALYCEVSFSGANDTLICIPPAGFIGWDTINVTVSDPGGLAARDTFRIFFRDAIPPGFTFGIFQNPVASRHLDIYFFPDEPIDSLHSVMIRGDTIQTDLMVHINPPPYHSHYKMSGSGAYQIVVTASDTSHNIGISRYDFSASFVSKRNGGILYSSDSTVQISFFSESIQSDEYVLCLPIDPKFASGQPNGSDFCGYSIIAPRQELSCNSKILFKNWSGSERLGIYRWNESGWEYLQTYSDETNIYYWAYIDRLGNYVLKRVAPELGVLVPSRFELAQNYPNPFNSATVIAFDLPKVRDRSTSEATLILYDVLGRKVATILNRSAAPGHYHLTWRSGNLPSGSYFYILKYGPYTAKKKMTVVK
ncbi:MAG: hypothetical protein ACP5FZ_04230 [Fidelibacterota bacterium]